jgi:hypothetical protein
MRQQQQPNRKRPEFRRCPVCGTEFRIIANPNQRWCSRECAQATRGGWRALPRRQSGP